MTHCFHGGKNIFIMNILQFMETLLRLMVNKMRYKIVFCLLIFLGGCASNSLHMIKNQKSCVNNEQFQVLYEKHKSEVELTATEQQEFERMANICEIEHLKGVRLGFLIYLLFDLLYYLTF